MRNLLKSLPLIGCSNPAIHETRSRMMLEIRSLRKTMVKGPSTSFTILNQTNVRLHMIMASTILTYTQECFFEFIMVQGDQRWKIFTNSFNPE